MTVGLFMPCWNNEQLIEKAILSLRLPIPFNYPYQLMVFDGGSVDSTVSILDRLDVDVRILPQPRKNCMNEMMELLLGPYNKETRTFPRKLDYVGFLHSDADYNVDPGWLPRLVNECWVDPKIGCIGPAHNAETWAMHPPGLHAANCPIFIMPVRVVRELYHRHGWWIDPNYWSGTSYCDWDFQWNLKALGYKSVLSTKSRINHFCNGTRAKLWITEPDFRRRDEENKVYYHSKWPAGVCPFEEKT